MAVGRRFIAQGPGVLYFPARMVTPQAGGRLAWQLTIAEETAGDVHVFAPVGRLGTLSSGELIEPLVSAIKQGRRRLVLDLSGVDYVSSAGLLALEAVSTRLHLAGGELVVCGLAEPVRLVFDLAGLLELFTVETSRADAIERLRPAAVSDGGGRTPAAT